MKKSLSLSLALGALLATTSCQQWGPNQQSGTVIGGLAGAGLGAIIGSNSGRNYGYGRHGYYNRGSGNAGEGALIGAAVGAVAGNLLGASQDQREYAENQYYAPPAGTTATGQPTAQLPPRYASTSRTNVNIGIGYGSGYRYGGGGYGSVGINRSFPIYNRRPYYGRGYGYGRGGYGRGGYRGCRY